MKFFIYFVFAIFISISFLIMVTLKKKKNEFKEEIQFKSYVTPWCFLAAGVIGFIANVVGFLGGPIWWLVIIFVMVGAYFTKYLPKPGE